MVITSFTLWKWVKSTWGHQWVKCLCLRLYLNPASCMLRQDVSFNTASDLCCSSGQKKINFGSFPSPVKVPNIMGMTIWSQRNMYLISNGKIIYFIKIFYTSTLFLFFVLGVLLLLVFFCFVFCFLLLWTCPNCVCGGGSFKQSHGN